MKVAHIVPHRFPVQSARTCRSLKGSGDDSDVELSQDALDSLLNRFAFFRLPQAFAELAAGDCYGEAKAGLAQGRQFAGRAFGGGLASTGYRKIHRVAGVELRDGQLPQVLVQMARLSCPICCPVRIHGNGEAFLLDLTRFGGHPKCGALPRRGCLEGEARAAKKAFVHTGVQG